MPNLFPHRIIDSVNGMVGKVKIAVLRAVTFNSALPYKLEFKDQDGNLITSVTVGIDNVEGLPDALDGKQGNLTSSDNSLTIDQENDDIKVNVEGWDLAADLHTNTPNIDL